MDAYTLGVQPTDGRVPARLAQSAADIAKSPVREVLPPGPMALDAGVSDWLRA